MSLEEPRTVPFPPFLKGVDHLTQPSFLAQGFVSKAKNIEFERGVAKQRKGFQARTFDDSGVMSAAGGLPLADASAVIGIALMWPATESGAEVEVYFDQNKAYLYNYADGTVNSLFDDTDGEVDIDCFVGSSKQVSWTIAPINKAGAVQPTLVFTDGLEYNSEHTIYEFDGSTVYSDNTPATALTEGRITMSDIGTEFQYAKQIMWFSDHFMIGDYATDGARYRNRVGWGDFQELGIITAGSDNGEYIISDAEGFLLRMIRLGPHLAIYFNESIVICDRVPTDDIYAFDVRVHGTGALAANAVANIGRGLHVFLGNDDVYAYDGGLAPEPIGDAVAKHILDSVNPDSVDTIVTQHLPLDNLVRWFLPIEAATQPNAVLVFNYREKTFSSLGKLAKTITSVGVGTRTASARCNDAQFVGVACNAGGLGACDDYYRRGGFAAPLLGANDGEVYEILESTTTDAGTAIVSELEGPSEFIGEAYGDQGAVVEVKVESKGAAFEMEYSTDHGETWTAISGSFGGFTKFTLERIAVAKIISSFFMLRVIMENSTTQIKYMSARRKTMSSRGVS